MAQALDPTIVISTARDIVVAYLSQRCVEPKELAQLIREVRIALMTDLPNTLEGDQGASNTAGLHPAVPIESSITPDFLISLEDGKPYRSLKRHLMARHGLTPEAYREKWGLAADYPMVAPNYARDRSEVAKRIGLGRNGAPSVRRSPQTSAKKPS